MIKAAIVGASGYGGGELIRLLSGHPQVEITALISETWAGKHPSAAFAGLRSSRINNLLFSSFGDGSQLTNCDVAFLAQDNGKAMKLAGSLVDSNCRVVDLSADFRFRDPSIYPEWYGFEHAEAELCRSAVYGLPELNFDDIQHAKIVGNPGCYPTASILALAPALQYGFVDPKSIIIDAKSGVSGAGRSKFTLDYHYPEANESVAAYKVGGKHRHVPEIEQALAPWSGSAHISFTPHLIPMSRGILATCYANLSVESVSRIRDAYIEFYAEKPFVHILDQGTPSTKHTLGSNQCHIGIEFDLRTHRLIVISAIDNLVKGMAGQAIQNMNIMFGLTQDAGLDLCGLWP